MHPNQPPFWSWLSPVLCSLIIYFGRLPAPFVAPASIIVWAQSQWVSLVLQKWFSHECFYISKEKKVVCNNKKRYKKAYLTWIHVAIKHGNKKNEAANIIFPEKTQRINTTVTKRVKSGMWIYLVAFTRNGGCHLLFRKMAETLRAHFGYQYHANTAESYHLHYMPSNNYIFFANFSKSMKNQDLKFHPLAIFGLLDMMNSSDRANGAGPQEIKKKVYILGSGLFRKHLKIYIWTYSWNLTPWPFLAFWRCRMVRIII